MRLRTENRGTKGKRDVSGGQLLCIFMNVVVVSRSVGIMTSALSRIGQPIANLSSKRPRDYEV